MRLILRLKWLVNVINAAASYISALMTILETIKKRLEVFFAETAPLIDYYSKSGKLLEVQGEGTMEEISARIVSALQSSKTRK